MENGTKTPNKKFENFKGFFKPKNNEKGESEKKGAKDAPVVDQSSGKSLRGFFKTAANEETAGKALLGLLLYSMLMFFLPIGVFFGSKQLLEDWEYEPPVSTIAPAILAIFTVNIVIVLYVIKAFREENKAKKIEDEQQKKK